MINYHLHFLIWVITLYLSQISKFPQNLFCCCCFNQAKISAFSMVPSTSQQYFFFFMKVPHIAVFTSSLLYKFHYRLKLYILTAQMGWSVIMTAGSLLEHTAYFNCGVDNFEELRSK